MARIAGINIPQNKVVSIALTYIHGIGLHSSKRICKKKFFKYSNSSTLILIIAFKFGLFKSSESSKSTNSDSFLKIFRDESLV